MRTKIISSIVLLSIGLFISACGNSAPAAQAPASTLPPVIASSAIIAEGRLEPIRYAEIAFKASGVVSEVLVKEGQPVKQGDPLIRLGDETDKNYAAAQFEFADAQKALNDLKNSAPADLAQAVIDLKDAQEEYDDAVVYLDYLKNTKKVPQTETRRFVIQNWKGYEYRVHTKHFKAPATADMLTEAQNDVGLKKAKLDTAQRIYDRMKGGIDADQLAVLEARLNAARARIATFSITAPFDGVVSRLDARLGNSVNAGEAAVTLADFSHWIVNTTDLTEIDVVNLKDGDSVIVTLDALPDVELKGTISSIAQTFAENQGDVVYEVTVMLTDIDPAMRWGMTAEVKFIVDE